MHLTDSRQPLPLLFYGVAITIRLTDASCGPAADHVGSAVHGAQAASERVDGTSFRDPWPESLVDGG